MNLKEYCRERWFEHMAETPAANFHIRHHMQIRRKSVEDAFINSPFMRSTGRWTPCKISALQWAERIAFYNSPQWKLRVAVDKLCDGWLP
jgi:hypothetical protein